MKPLTLITRCAWLDSSVVSGINQFSDQTPTHKKPTSPQRRGQQRQQKESPPPTGLAYTLFWQIAISVTIAFSWPVFSWKRPLKPVSSVWPRHIVPHVCVVDVRFLKWHIFHLKKITIKSLTKATSGAIVNNKIFINNMIIRRGDGFWQKSKRLLQPLFQVLSGKYETLFLQLQSLWETLVCSSHWLHSNIYNWSVWSVDREIKVWWSVWSLLKQLHRHHLERK